jgi:hypothetical protein
MRATDIFDIRASPAAALVTGRLSSEVASTEMMGATDMTVSIPKPSGAPTALLKPMPIDSTNGTVTGPVVTPGGGAGRCSKHGLRGGGSKAR